MLRVLTLLSLLLILPTATLAATVPDAYPAKRESSPADIASIQKVISDFQIALKTKDTKLLSSLMLHSRILFASPADQAGMDRIRKIDVNYDGVGISGFPAFASFIAGSKLPLEERFHNIEITQDGPVAWVLFDYEFVEGGKVGNYGVEHWQLRKADDQWKIFSVVWSTHEVEQK